VRRGFLGGVLDQEVGYAAEYRILRPDGEVRWVRDRGRPVRSSGSPPTRAAGVAVDVTERKAAEEQRELLLRELNHRVKNVLAVAGAIARQTGARVDSVPEFVEAFGGRLGALSASHELLTATGWRGARLADLVQRAMAPQLPRGGEQVRLAIPEVTVGPALAQNLTLVLHELATNALKYGALSLAEGRVALTGRAEAGELHLVWAEEGGPAVRPPTRQGFGTSLLGRVLGHHPAAGHLALDWRPEGLVCTMRLPFRAPPVGPVRRQKAATRPAS
jgi:two-component sensor histidine kinase